MAMAIDWDDLRIFQAALRAGGYSSAARRLGLDRTTVGRRLTRLERAVGRKLWEEDSEGPRPTAAGIAMLRAAGEMDRAMQRLAVDLGTGADGGQVRLASTTGIAGLFLAELARFGGSHPGIAIELTGARDAVAALHQRQADLGLAIVASKPADLAGVRIGAIAQALYAARDGAAARRVGWGHAARLALPQAWARLNVVTAGEPVVEVDSLPAMVDAVRAGLGAAWLWTFIGDAEPALARVTSDEAQRGTAAELWLLHRTPEGLEPAAERLRDRLVADLANRICADA